MAYLYVLLYVFSTSPPISNFPGRGMVGFLNRADRYSWFPRSRIHWNRVYSGVTLKTLSIFTSKHMDIRHTPCKRNQILSFKIFFSFFFFSYKNVQVIDEGVPKKKKWKEHIKQFKEESHSIWLYILLETTKMLKCYPEKAWLWTGQHVSYGTWFIISCLVLNKILIRIGNPNFMRNNYVKWRNQLWDI